MSEPVERVARALCIAAGENPDAVVPDPPPGEWPSDKHPWRPVWAVRYTKPARAAIEAMREPTDAMISAGADAMLREYQGGELHAIEPLIVGHGCEQPSKSWRSMIDAALKA